MASFLDYEVFDTNGVPATMRIPITTQAADTAVVDYAAAVGTALFGTTKLLIGGVKRVNLVITDLGFETAVSDNSDSRQKWQATMHDGSGNNFRFSMPTRNEISSLIVGGSGYLGNISTSPFTTVLAALLDVSGDVHMVNTLTDLVAASWSPVISTVLSRKRPRIGGVR